MSKKADIAANLAARLAKITTANGYSKNVNEIFYDTIPMGISLNEFQLPAIFLIDRTDNLTTQFDKLVNRWTFDLQLWDIQSPDSAMYGFVADVLKCIYADSPTAQIHGAFRSIHPAIVEINPLSVASDLQMIEANRIMVMTFELHYRTNLFDF